MVEESCYGIKGGSPQIKHEGDDANVIFEVGGVPSIKSGHSTRLIQDYKKY